MPRSLWLLVIGMMLNVTGSTFLWPVNTIYIHEHLGKSLTVAGIVLLFNSGAGVLGNLAGGALFDRLGGYRAILTGVSISLTALILLVFNHNFLSYAILLAVIGFGMGITFPSMYAMAGSVWKEGGRKAFNAIYVAQNVGVAAGAAIGGLVASYSFQWSFIGNAFLFVLFFLLVLFGYREFSGRSGEVAPETILTQDSRVKNKTVFTALLILCGGYLLAWICYVQWQSTIAVHTQEAGVSLREYSLLWTVNGALIVVLQPALAYVLKRWITSTKAQMFVGYIIFIISFLIVSRAEAFAGFMAAMVILTIGEMFVWPGVPSIANDLAPPGKAGFYQGVVNSTATAGRMLGPSIGGILADTWGMNAVFGVIIVLFIISILLTQLYDRKIAIAALPEQKTG